MYFSKKRANVLENGVAKAKNKLKPIDASVYRYWEALFLSFYSTRLYVDVGKRWRGFGLLYLLLVIVILAIPFSLRMSANFSDSFNQQVLEPLAQIPTIYVQNGEASFDKPMPYLIKNKKNQVVAIVDTSGRVETFSDKYPYLTVLLTKEKIAFRMPTPQLFGIKEQLPSGEPMVQNFNKGVNLIFDGKKIIADNTISQLKLVSEFMIYPIVIAILFSILLVVLLVLGFLGQVFARIFFSFHITFMQGSRLLMVSSTPMLLLLITLLTTNLIFPGVGIILVAVLISYFCLALYSLRSESKRMSLL
jgi:hypothetical protein